MILRPGAGVPQLQQDKLRGHDRLLDLGLCQRVRVRRVTRVQQSLIEKRVGEDGVHEDLETPYRCSSRLRT
jgi:hypothetical protein